MSLLHIYLGPLIIFQKQTRIITTVNQILIWLIWQINQTAAKK